MDYVAVLAGKGEMVRSMSENGAQTRELVLKYTSSN